MATEHDTGIGPHGNINPLFLGHYSKGCRCNECVIANREYKRRYIARKTSIDPDYQNRIARKWRESPQGVAAIRHRTIMLSQSHEHRAKCVAKSQELIACRRRLLWKIKMERGCVDCGYRKHPVALDFDHVTGEKFMELSVMCTFSLARIMEEVAKCEVVCYCCHRRRTRSRMLSGESTWVRKRKLCPTADAEKIARYRDRGWKFLSQLKLEHGCNDCGYKDCSESLDFDHVRGVKKFDISQRVYYAIATLKKEIAKCDVVCANCHRIRTFERRRAMTAVT